MVVNPNNQQFILDSRINGAIRKKIIIPCYTQHNRDTEVFLGAVKITKAYNGICYYWDMINSKQYFNYYTPNTGTEQTGIYLQQLVCY